jgi:hypothetical protein
MDIRCGKGQLKHSRFLLKVTTHHITLSFSIAVSDVTKMSEVSSGSVNAA